MIRLVSRTLVIILLLSLIALLLVGLMDAKIVSAQNVIWTRQFGSSNLDYAQGVSVYGSGVYVVGLTSGALPGQTYKGGVYDAFVRKYDVYGSLKWTRQFGTSSNDEAHGVSVSGSGVYVVGGTSGALPGQTSKGGIDAFVRKYDVDGNLKWTRQFGSSSGEVAYGVSVYSSGVYVVGWTWSALPGQTSKGENDAFVRKYDVDGNLKWTRQFGTSTYDSGYCVSVDSSGVYVTGYTYGALSGQTNKGKYDAFVCKYDVDGNLKWTRQFGSTSIDFAQGVSVYGSGVYVAGYTDGALPGQTNRGSDDAFVRKYDVDGNLKWTRQFGTSTYDSAYCVSVYGSGVYVVGETSGALPGQTSKGDIDAFVRKYDVYGSLKWTRQFGSSNIDEAHGVSVYSSGVCVAGWTRGALPDQTNKGGDDAFVRKYAPL